MVIHAELSPRQRRQVVFWRKYLRLTRGRVPVLRALDVIAEEDPTEFGKIVATVRKTMDSGRSTLSEAIREFPQEFPASVVELVRTAEKSGAWDEILQEIADGLAEGTFG